MGEIDYNKIEIDSYIKAVFSVLEYIDIDLLRMNAGVIYGVRYDIEFTKKDKFTERRKTVFEGLKVEFDIKKISSPFDESETLGKVINETYLEVINSVEWEFINTICLDFKDMNFEALADVSGMIDYYNYLLEFYSDSLKDVNETQCFKRLNFDFKDTEFVELVKSLMLNKNVWGGTQKEIIQYFSNVLNHPIDEENFHKKADKLRTRHIGSEAIFLNKLKTSLLNWLQK